MADVYTDAETIGVLVHQSQTPEGARASFSAMQGFSISFELASRLFTDALSKKFPDPAPVAASFLVRTLK
jgi:hypothetical protein